MAAGPSENTIVSLLGDDLLESIVRVIWTDRNGNLTIVGFLIARAWRATCKAFLAATRRCNTPWDGVVSSWVPLDDLPDRMVEEGYDECHVRQLGCNGSIPHSFQGGNVMGRMYVNETGVVGQPFTASHRMNDLIVDERDEKAVDPSGLTYNKSLSGFLTILRDTATDRVMILNVHGDAFDTVSELGDNFAFDVWDLPQCMRMFCVQSSDRIDQVPLMAQAVSGTPHTYTRLSIAHAHTQSNILPMIRFNRAQYDGTVDGAGTAAILALAPDFWMYTGNQNCVRLFPLEREEGKCVKLGVCTNRLVFSDHSVLRISHQRSSCSLGDVVYSGNPEFVDVGVPALLNWPGLPLNAVPPLMTVCGHHETPHRLNACLADLLHRRTWDMPADLRTAGIMDLDRRVQEEGDFARVKQQMVREEAEARLGAPTALVVAMESDDEDEPQLPTPKRPCTRNNANVRAKIAATMEDDGSTYESGRMLASMNDEPDGSGYVDDQYAFEEQEREEMDRTVECEEIEARRDADWNSRNSTNSTNATRAERSACAIVPAVDEDEPPSRRLVSVAASARLEEVEREFASTTARFQAAVENHRIDVRAMQARCGSA
tara:strand:+ start:2674 stop:4476 length:1803 start_codon:yes stop_codon:yes gene_type:complete